MSLRTRLILAVSLLAVVSLGGTFIIVDKLNSLGTNQEVFSFKDTIYHDHKNALELIQSAQSRLYQHQAGYSRNIDQLVNDIHRFDELLESIPLAYRLYLQPRYCASCHDEAGARVDELAETIDSLKQKVRQYREHISILITTSDYNTQVIHHGHANAIGEDIIETISIINKSAGRMIDDLLLSNEEILSDSVLAIQGAMSLIVFISLAIMAYTLWALHRLVTSLLKGTESIYRDDFSLRLPALNRKDEFGLLASRFNLMAEHLQERDGEIKEKTGLLQSANLQLRDLNDNLELRIRERTTELEDLVDRLQSTTSALEESKRRLEAANVDLVKANQAKANFLSIVSHELKTPLSVINGFLSLILDERYQNDPKNLKEAVEISKRRGQQLARMIDELIDLSRLDARAMVLHKEAVNVGEALGDVTEQFREDLQRKQIRISYVDCTCLPAVECDNDKFKQVMTNLVSNAVKFSPEGSTIEIGCRETEAEFVFFCHDEGIGLAPQERGKVFDKFYQVDSSATRRYGGAGLGLSIVKEIIQLHGGRIWVESEEGKGCSFFFTIPRGSAMVPPEGETAALTPGS